MSKSLSSRFYHIHPLGRSGALRHSPLLELDKTCNHIAQLTVLFLSGEICFFTKEQNIKNAALNLVIWINYTHIWPLIQTSLGDWTHGLQKCASTLGKICQKQLHLSHVTRVLRDPFQYVKYEMCQTKSGITPQNKKDASLKFLQSVFQNNTNQVASKSQCWKKVSLFSWCIILCSILLLHHCGCFVVRFSILLSSLFPFKHGILGKVTRKCYKEHPS